MFQGDQVQDQPLIALEQIREACAAGVPRGVLLMDASYGSNSALRTNVSALGLSYVAGIVATVKVRVVSDRGAAEQRISVKELALGLPKHAWRTITWREGSNKRLRSRFAVCRCARHHQARCRTEGSDTAD